MTTSSSSTGWLAKRGAAVVRRIAPTRTYGVWYGVALALGIVLCNIPLFWLVGYESAAVCGAVFGPAAGFLTLHALRRDVIAEPLAVERTSNPADDFVATAGRHLLLVALPFAALLLNALRVRNCGLGSGTLFWLAIPLVSVLLGQTVGWLVASVTSRTWWVRNLLVAAVVAISAATFGLRLALEPPIVAHQPFLGYFSGSIYDEALALPTSLLAYRAMNLTAAAAGLAAVEGLRRHRAGRPRRWVAAVGLGAIAVFGSLFWARQDLGVGIDREYIQGELGGRLETEHFIIHYPETETFVDELDRLAEDHEYRYAELQRFFETDPASDGKLHSYVYPDRETKGRLMGARETLVAKLWMGEIHVLWRNVGDHLLAHELAHLFTEPFGSGPLRLSMQYGVGVNMGLVEGVATAADWPVREMSPHRAAAALRRLEMAPSIRGIVGASGFWTRAAGRAYTMVGSFIRYLVDEYGIERFKRAYGGGDFQGAYDRPIDELIAEWHDFLNGLELDDSTIETAKYLYRRPSIFERVCPRTTAEVRRRARIAAARGDVGEMRRLYRRLLGYSPGNVNDRIEFANELIRAGDVSGSLEVVRDSLDSELPPVQRTRLRELRGDARWHRQQYDAARRAYGRCLEAGVPLDRRRMLLVKRKALQTGRDSVRALAFDYLLGDLPGRVSLYPPMEWMRRRPNDAVSRYLVGRRLWQHERWDEAVEHLRAAEAGLDAPALRGEARRMLGRSLYFSGELDEAASIFARLRESPVPRYREEGREWLDRVDWRRRSDVEVE